MSHVTLFLYFLVKKTIFRYGLRITVLTGHLIRPLANWLLISSSCIDFLCSEVCLALLTASAAIYFTFFYILGNLCVINVKWEYLFLQQDLFFNSNFIYLTFVHIPFNFLHVWLNTLLSTFLFLKMKYALLFSTVI